MASTWSNLKIQLMTTGENSTTWGTVTNANLGTAIEEAIAGSADVTFASNNQTITLTNTTATQTARNMRLNLTGTTGGSTRTLTVPDIEKVYIVNNGCADAVQVKNSTGANVSVPAGKSMWLFSTGTAVVDVTTHLSSLTLGSALPVASGGTGSTTAAFSGANITSLNASNISSGVLAVANGGTGSATATFSGANITSLNVSNVAAGVLAATYGGTGLASPGTAGNVLSSTGSAWASTALTTFTSGMIMLWSGSIASIPSGWALCDGSNGTPNLRDRFIVGAGSSYAVGATGGSADAIVVSHSHTATSSVSDPGHNHSATGSVVNYAFNSSNGTSYSPTNTTATSTSTTGISVSTSVSSTGSSGTNANLPPYYALAYIMKL